MKVSPLPSVSSGARNVTGRHDFRQLPDIFERTGFKYFQFKIAGLNFWIVRQFLAKPFHEIVFARNKIGSMLMLTGSLNPFSRGSICSRVVRTHSPISILSEWFSIRSRKAPGGRFPVPDVPSESVLQPR